MMRILSGHCLDRLRELPAESVHCVVTSPPYYGLRDYGIEPQVWGGEAGCEHEWGDETIRKQSPQRDHAPDGSFGDTRGTEASRVGMSFEASQGAFCRRCGAWRGSLGLEPTPALYIEHMVAVFREVKRVLRKDGTLWLNIGDSYASTAPGTMGDSMSRLPGISAEGAEARRKFRPKTPTGIKPKDLLGIPWALAQALRDPYYAGRIKEERDRAWLAGIMDGEGTICGFHHIRKDDGSPRTGINLTVTNSNIPLLDECYRIWPTSQRDHNKHDEGHYGSLPTYRWIVHGTENKTLLIRELFPYLVAKKAQVVVAYNLLLLVKDAKRLGHTAQRDSVREKRKSLTEMLSDLNHARPVDLPTWLVDPPSVLEPGWWLRSEITWAKRAPMPESCQDRPTTATEKVFLLTKSARYFYDAEAVKEPLEASSIERGYSPGYLDPNHNPEKMASAPDDVRAKANWRANPYVPNGRNMRNFWLLGPEPFPEAHFATYPTEIPRRAILAGTSEKGVCPKCGAGWERAVAKAGTTRVYDRGACASDHRSGTPQRTGSGSGALSVETETIGWRAPCECHCVPIAKGNPQPATVLDPFLGAGTTALVADRLGRHCIGIELNEKYAVIAERRCREDAGMFAEIAAE